MYLKVRAVAEKKCGCRTFFVFEVLKRRDHRNFFHFFYKSMIWNIVMYPPVALKIENCYYLLVKLDLKVRGEFANPKLVVLETFNKDDDIFLLKFF